MNTSNIEECQIILESISQRTIRLRSKSNDLLQMLERLIFLFQKLSVNEREVILNSIKGDLGLKLIMSGVYAAEKAMDLQDASWIKVGLMTHVLEGFRNDYRENIRQLVLLYDAAGHLKTDFQTICCEVIKFSPDDVKYQLQLFCAREPSLNKLQSFGIKLSKDEQGHKYLAVEK